VRRERVAGAAAVGAPRHRAERRGHPLAGAVALRVRELARRPVVVAAFSLQAMAVLAAVVLGAVAAEGLAGAGDDLILGGLRVTAVPGGLVFGVLVAAVVGAEFGWATERVLLARDPRRLRFAGYQLAVAVLAAALAATLVYGLLGAACALVLRGALAGVVALLAYGLLGELVLAPQWAPASGWTVYASAARLGGQGTTSVARAVLVVALAFVVALAGCLALYARRQVRD